MKEKELADLTDEELQHKWKDIKSPHQITIATLIVAILFTIIRALVDGFSFSLFYMPAFIALITTVLWINYKSIQKEMKARNLDE
jgi:Na+-translocating ferredoxin:NAD+ oxidoreductase RnfE subunit